MWIIGVWTRPDTMCQRNGTFIFEIVRAFGISWSMVSCVQRLLDGRHCYPMWTVQRLTMGSYCLYLDRRIWGNKSHLIQDVQISSVFFSVYGMLEQKTRHDAFVNIIFCDILNWALCSMVWWVMVLLVLALDVAQILEGHGLQLLTRHCAV